MLIKHDADTTAALADGTSPLEAVIADSIKKSVSGQKQQQWQKNPFAEQLAEHAAQFLRLLEEYRRLPEKLQDVAKGIAALIKDSPSPLTAFHHVVLTLLPKQLQKTVQNLKIITPSISPLEVDKGPKPHY